MPIGQIPHRFEIQSVSLNDPCEITTTEDHDFETHNLVRLTNLNGMVPIPIGVDPLNSNRYRIIVTGDTTFTLQDPITFATVDSTTYPPYSSGGSVNLIATEFIYYGDA